MISWILMFVSFMIYSWLFRYMFDGIGIFILFLKRINVLGINLVGFNWF